MHISSAAAARPARNTVSPSHAVARCLPIMCGIIAPRFRCPFAGTDSVAQREGHLTLVQIESAIIAILCPLQSIVINARGNQNDQEPELTDQQCRNDAGFPSLSFTHRSTSPKRLTFDGMNTPIHLPARTNPKIRQEIRDSGLSDRQAAKVFNSTAPPPPSGGACIDCKI